MLSVLFVCGVGGCIVGRWPERAAGVHPSPAITYPLYFFFSLHVTGLRSREVAHVRVLPACPGHWYPGRRAGFASCLSCLSPSSRGPPRGIGTKLANTAATDVPPSKGGAAARGRLQRRAAAPGAADGVGLHAATRRPLGTRRNRHREGGWGGRRGGRSTQCLSRIDTYTGHTRHTSCRPSSAVLTAPKGEGGRDKGGAPCRCARSCPNVRRCLTHAPGHQFTPPPAPRVCKYAREDPAGASSANPPAGAANVSTGAPRTCLATDAAWRRRVSASAARGGRCRRARRCHLPAFRAA